MLEKCGEKWNPHTLLVGKKFGSCLNIAYTTQPSNFTPRYLPKKNKNMCQHKDCMWIFMAALFIIPQNWKQNKYPSWFNQMVKQSVVYPYYGTILINKTAWTTDMCDMNEP